MTDREPGPFWQREPLPLPPRVVHDGTFVALAGELVDVLGDADRPLGAASDTVGRDVPTDLDATFESTIGVAEDVTGGQFPIDRDQTADTLTQDGEGAESYRQSVLRFLPQPDAPVEMELKDPPQVPHGPADTGGGDREDTPAA